jgi:uncharacterized Ntn-hydrolase superfamily protein
MFGVAIATSSICVGARCPHVRAGAGAVATQNITDPALGPTILDELERGADAENALARVTDGKAFLDFRQLTVVDRTGATASWTGSKILGTHSVSEGIDCLAAGNLLSDVGVTGAMTTAFAADPGNHLAERLLRGLEAGVAAGGEMGEIKSACLLVADKLPFPLVDLRVDWADAPEQVLRQLWIDYQPQMQDYVNRAVNPTAAPSYGVPGDD